VFTRIHHLSLVVPDIREARSLWVDIYGFRPDHSAHSSYDGTHSREALTVAVGESLVQVLQPLEPDSGTTRFLEKRGAGPHHLCLSSDDIDEDVRRLQAGGLRLLGATTGSPDQKEGYRVAFFHPSTNMGVLLEIRQDIPASDEISPQRIGRGGALTRFHHIGLVAPNIEMAAQLFCGVYGLQVDPDLSPLPYGRSAPQDNVRVLDIPLGESEIEVVVPQDENSGTARFLATRGAGIHHVCFNSEDIEYDMGRLRDSGLQEVGVVSEGRDGAGLVGWLHPKSNLGLLVEIEQDVK
jgi:methylmalonyl-CoA/ethylmalonyl-CoA epimerase